MDTEKRLKPTILRRKVNKNIGSYNDLLDHTYFKINKYRPFYVFSVDHSLNDTKAVNSKIILDEKTEEKSKHMSSADKKKMHIRKAVMHKGKVLNRQTKKNRFKKRRNHFEKKEATNMVDLASSHTTTGKIMENCKINNSYFSKDAQSRSFNCENRDSNKTDKNAVENDKDNTFILENKSNRCSIKNEKTIERINGLFDKDKNNLSNEKMGTKPEDKSKLVDYINYLLEKNLEVLENPRYVNVKEYEKFMKGTKTARENNDIEKLILSRSKSPKTSKTDNTDGTDKNSIDESSKQKTNQMQANTTKENLILVGNKPFYANAVSLQPVDAIMYKEQNNKNSVQSCLAMLGGVLENEKFSKQTDMAGHTENHRGAPQESYSEIDSLAVSIPTPSGVNECNNDKLNMNWEETMTCISNQKLDDNTGKVPEIESNPCIFNEQYTVCHDLMQTEKDAPGEEVKVFYPEIETNNFINRVSASQARIKVRKDLLKQEHSKISNNFEKFPNLNINSTQTYITVRKDLLKPECTNIDNPNFSITKKLKNNKLAKHVPTSGNVSFEQQTKTRVKKQKNNKNMKKRCILNNSLMESSKKQRVDTTSCSTKKHAEEQQSTAVLFSDTSRLRKHIAIPNEKKDNENLNLVTSIKCIIRGESNVFIYLPALVPNLNIKEVIKQIKLKYTFVKPSCTFHILKKQQIDPSKKETRQVSRNNLLDGKGTDSRPESNEMVLIAKIINNKFKACETLSLEEQDEIEVKLGMKQASYFKNKQKPYPLKNTNAFKNGPFAECSVRINKIENQLLGRSTVLESEHMPLSSENDKDVILKSISLDELLNIPPEVPLTFIGPENVDLLLKEISNHNLKENEHIYFINISKSLLRVYMESFLSFKKAVLDNDVKIVDTNVANEFFKIKGIANSYRHYANILEEAEVKRKEREFSNRTLQYKWNKLKYINTEHSYKRILFESPQTIHLNKCDDSNRSQLIKDLT